MGTLYSGVGLISGLNHQSIVDQLMAIEARPRNFVLARIGNIDAQKTAYLDISARITALLSRIQLLSRPSTFQAATAQSSLPDVLSATAGAGARPGSYQFIVRALAASHQFVSRGFHNRTATMAPGTLTIESAQARVDRSTRLEELNGHAGVQRGSFKITNAAGQHAVINITDALTVAEVIDKIDDAGISVQASVRGDGLVLTDSSGGTGTLHVKELNGGQAAAGLGFGPGHTHGSPGGELAGSSVVYLSEATLISSLNDGLGVRRSVAGGDFTIKVDQQNISVDLSDLIKPDTRLERLNRGQGVRLGSLRITSKDGAMSEVDLTGAKNVNDVKVALEGAFGDGRISVALAGSRLLINDNTQGGENDLIIEDVTGYAARDLGIDGRTSGAQIDGRDVVHMDTLADLINAINYAVGNEGPNKEPLIVASIAADGQGLVLENRSPAGGPFTLEVPSGSASKALFDLGFEPGTYFDPGGGARADGARILGGLDSVLLKTLNGGAGFVGGTIRISTNGQTADVDLASAQTLADVVRLINEASSSAGLGIEAAYDATGTRLTVSNVGGGTAPITISDLVGDFAASTGLAQTASSIRSNNLQRQYVSEATRLEDLSAGRGVSLGSFTITDSTGAFETVELTSGAYNTMRDVIEAINELGIGVEARVNDTGDGLLIVDTAGGAGPLKIEDEGGTTARDLNILGESEEGRIDGSFEFKLEVGGSDTLEDFAERIGAETTLADATLLNDGTSIAPYRLSISSSVSGLLGELIIDDSGTDFGITTLTRPQDARILFGGNPESGILLTSSDNTFDNIVDGLSITVSGVSDDPVTVTVGRDLESLISTMNGLVSEFNDAMDRIADVGGYDVETEVAGVLFGESALRTIENRLRRMFGRAVVVGGELTRLSQVGLKFESGSRLSFDEEKFREAFEADPEGVTRFFTDKDHGIAHTIQEELERITDPDGLIDRRTDALDDRRELLQDRVDHLNDLLERKRARLMRQFQAMEIALSQLQSQQSALASLAAMANSSAYWSQGSGSQ